MLRSHRPQQLVFKLMKSQCNARFRHFSRQFSVSTYKTCVESSTISTLTCQELRFGRDVWETSVLIQGTANRLKMDRERETIIVICARRIEIEL